MAAFSSDKFPNVFRLRERVKQQLEQILIQFDGKKDIVLDPDLMRPFDRIVGAGYLKEKGVDKIFKLDRIEKQKSISGCDRRIYFVRPKINLMKIIANQITTEAKNRQIRKYRIVMVPRKLYLCEMILEQEGVYGLCELDELDLDLLPVDTDILSLEAPEFFRSFYLDRDLTWMHSVSKSIQTIQNMMGEIPNVYTMGRAGKMCYELLKAMSGKEKLISPDYPKSEIGHLFIIDREIDFVTPLCSQVIYEGLLDDMFGIHCGCIEFEKEVTMKDEPVKVMLTNQDDIYESIRNRHFTNVFDLLKSKAQDLQSVSDKRKNLASVSDMKDFVANDLRDLNKSKAILTYHIGACEQIILKKNKDDFQEMMQTEHCLLEGSSFRECVSYIEECINKQNPSLSILRLLCLLSLANSGIPPKDYKLLKTQFLQSHGFEHIITFHNLKAIGFLQEQGLPVQSKVPIGVAALMKTSSFRNLQKKLNLIPTGDIDLRNPCDMSYVFSGAYTPLSCKLIEQCLQHEGFLGMEEIVKYLPGGVDAVVKLRTPGKGSKGNLTNAAPGRAAKVVLVYFVGGCTYSEIAALRFLGKQTGYKFIVATTAIFTANTLLETVIEKP